MNKDLYGPSDGNERIYIEELQRQIDDLRSTLVNVAQAQDLGNVVQQGFAILSSQLEPLRDMRPDRAEPDPEQAAKFNSILKAIEQPGWHGPDFDADKPKNNLFLRSQS